MRRRVVAGLLAVAAAAAAAVAAGVPGGIVVEVTLALAVIVAGRRWLRYDEVPDPFETALATPPARMPEPMAALSKRLEAAFTSGTDTHRILRPILRDLADERLRQRGVAMHNDPHAASDALGPDLWDLVRDGRPRPAADAPPWTREDLRDAIRRLEAL